MARSAGQLRAGLTLLLVVAVALPAHAHKLSIFATATDGQVQGKVYFPTGAASGLTVTLVDAEGNVVEKTDSDADGRFKLPLSTSLPLTVVSETVDGHRAEFALDAPEAAESPAESNDTAMPATATGASLSEAEIRGIVHEELQPLREQLAEQAGRSRARDIFGGIGYIVGVFGLVALLKRQSGKAP